MKRLSVLALLALVSACSSPGGTPGAPLGMTPSATGSRITSPSAFAHRSERVVRFTTPVGSSNTITADMPVPRPDTTPCTVVLFKDYAFKNFNNQTYSYAPPSACKGPWAKVVFNLNLRVSQGIQYDRTAIIWLNGAPIFFGTTAEPTPNLAPHWHVEQDVTDLSALFAKGGSGQIALGNCYCPPNYTGIQYGTAYLQFYPPNAAYPAPRVADEVLGVPYQPPLGGSSQLPQSKMHVAGTFPRNVYAAYLDLYLQSQNAEEQWFMCVPTSVWNTSKNALGFCPGTAFREGEVAVDGHPAGTAPIYPWIYTGGMDPDLWAPIPGVQTLAFTPYRVNLTPFAGVLDAAGTHAVSVSVDHAISYFTGAGDLLLFRDRHAAVDTGKLTGDTLSAMPPLGVANTVKYGKGTGLFGGATAAGTITTTSRRAYAIEGYVDTSFGRVTTSVRVASTFSNLMQLTYTSGAYVQDAYQDTTLKKITTTQAGQTTSTRSVSLE